MAESEESEITRLLRGLESGEPGQADLLLTLVYDELRALARAHMAREHPGRTLQATELVHEAWLRVAGTQAAGWNGRAHFFGAAARAMRRILVEKARKRGRLKRGGGTPILRLDFETAEGELRHHDAADDLDPEAWFHREWVRNLFTLAVDELRRRCEVEGKPLHFALFERYDLEGETPETRLTYAELAAQHGIPVTQVNNYLAAARRDFRAIVLELLRDVTGSDAEFRQEAQQLLGADPP